jgi:hypothetical protein
LLHGGNWRILRSMRAALRVTPKGEGMLRAYRVLFRLAMSVGVGVFALLVLAAFGQVSGLTLGGWSLWPAAIVAGFASVFVASWACAKAKGRSGWLGVLLPLLDVVGLRILARLESRVPRETPPRRGAPAP